jgi:hypothetical protein
VTSPAAGPVTGVAPPASRAPLDRWRGYSRTVRVVLTLFFAVVAVNAFLAVVQRATEGYQPSGPSSSSLATDATGYEAWADLLAQSGHAVVRYREPLNQALGGTPPVSTVVVADPASLSSAEITSLHQFLVDGGRVVAIGVKTVPLLQSVLGTGAPRWAPVALDDATPAGAPVPETTGVGLVSATGSGGSWSSDGRAQPILEEDGAALALVAGVGQGRLVMVADSSVFSNQELATADNAQFALDVVGPAGARVAFDENAHGFGEGTGFGGLPLSWQWTVVIGTVAAGLWLWSRGRRFGPPELAGRVLPPPRRRYVEAVGTLLARTRPSGAGVEPVRSAARALLAVRASVPPDVGDAVLAGAASEAGVPQEVVAGALGGGQTGADVLAAGRALAWLEEARR